MAKFTVSNGDKVLLEDVAFAIQQETDTFLKNDVLFITKGNKQAAKRARVASLNLSRLAKKYREISMRVISEKD